MQVRQRPFKAIADLNAHLSIVLGDQKQHAIVVARLPEFPCPEQSVRIGFDRLSAEVRHGRHHQLSRGRFLERLEFRSDRRFGCGVDHPRIINHSASQ